MVKVVGEDIEVDVLTVEDVERIWDELRYPFRMRHYIIEINIPLDAKITDEAKAFVETRAMRIRRLNFEIK